MKNTISLVGNVSGALGIAICLVAGIARITGKFHLGGFEAMTLFNGGVALMVAACLFKLHAMEQR